MLKLSALQPVSIFMDSFLTPREQIAGMTMLPGQCKIRKVRTAAAEHFYSRNDYRMAKGVKELTLSDTCCNWAFNSISSHPFILSQAFGMMQLEAFKVELRWTNWNSEVLERLSVDNLKVLNIPLFRPLDCVTIGQALIRMPRLESLTITDIPNKEEYFAELECLGKGILSCASTLRKLDIELRESNPLPLWAAHDQFFHKLYPCLLSNDLVEKFVESPSRDYRHDTDSAGGPPLHLTTLRLKHLSLPWYSFGLVFDPTTIKKLDLPYSMADDDLWKLLAANANLDTLTEIGYNMLSTGFLHFLRQQSSLTELTFARPQGLDHRCGTISYGISDAMSYVLPRGAHRPQFGYPKLEEFSSSIMNMTMLKHLKLPANMYKLTRDSLFSIAVFLTSLEHLELGFNYDDSVRSRDLPFRVKKDTRLT